MSLRTYWLFPFLKQAGQDRRQTMLPELLAIAAFAVALTCIILAALDSRSQRISDVGQSEPYEADTHPGRYRTAPSQLVDSHH
jgi:hypothetical protein